MEQFAPTFVAFDVAENFCVPAALPSQSVIGEILFGIAVLLARSPVVPQIHARMLLQNILSRTSFQPHGVNWQVNPPRLGS